MLEHVHSPEAPAESEIPWLAISNGSVMTRDVVRRAGATRHDFAGWDGSAGSDNETG